MMSSITFLKHSRKIWLEKKKKTSQESFVLQKHSCIQRRSLTHTHKKHKLDKFLSK